MLLAFLPLSPSTHACPNHLDRHVTKANTFIASLPPSLYPAAPFYLW